MLTSQICGFVQLSLASTEISPANAPLSSFHLCKLVWENVLKRWTEETQHFHHCGRQFSIFLGVRISPFIRVERYLGGNVFECRTNVFKYPTNSGRSWNSSHLIIPAQWYTFRKKLIWNIFSTGSYICCLSKTQWPTSHERMCYNELPEFQHGSNIMVIPLNTIHLWELKSSEAVTEALDCLRVSESDPGSFLPSLLVLVIGSLVHYSHCIFA